MLDLVVSILLTISNLLSYVLSDRHLFYSFVVLSGKLFVLSRLPPPIQKDLHRMIWILGSIVSINTPSAMVVNGINFGNNSVSSFGTRNLVVWQGRSSILVLLDQHNPFKATHVNSLLACWIAAFVLQRLHELACPHFTLDCSFILVFFKHVTVFFGVNVGLRAVKMKHSVRVHA